MDTALLIIFGSFAFGFFGTMGIGAFLQVSDWATALVKSFAKKRGWIKKNTSCW